MTRPRLLPVLRLCRIGMWFSPAADVLAGAAVAEVAFDGAVARAMLASMLLYGAGMVWNDIADRELDAIQRPERPLPRGDLSQRFAAMLGVALLGAGLAVTPCFTHHALIASLVMFYDFLGKRLEWLAALNMGTLRALNLGTGLQLAAADAPETARRALLLAALCYGIYIVAVTIVGIFEDTPSVRARAVSTVQAAPPIVAFAGVAVVQGVRRRRLQALDGRRKKAALARQLRRHVQVRVGVRVARAAREKGPEDAALIRPAGPHGLVQCLVDGAELEVKVKLQFAAL